MADKMATREAYGNTLKELGAKYPNLVVMDADLSGSTKTAVYFCIFWTTKLAVCSYNLYFTFLFVYGDFYSKFL